MVCFNAEWLTDIIFWVVLASPCNTKGLFFHLSIPLLCGPYWIWSISNWSSLICAVLPLQYYTSQAVRWSISRHYQFFRVVQCQDRSWTELILKVSECLILLMIPGPRISFLQSLLNCFTIPMNHLTSVTFIGDYMSLIAQTLFWSEWTPSASTIWPTNNTTIIQSLDV